MRRMMSMYLFLFMPSMALAQADPPPTGDKVIIKMTLHPTSAPVPIYKLHFFPDYADIQPGNRVQGLLKCFMEQDNFFRTVGNEEWQKRLECPLSEFKADMGIFDGIAYKGKKYTTMGGYLDKGARFKSIDWNEYFDLRNDGFYLLLPEVQKMRALCSVLRMRLRSETKSAEFDKCVVTVQSLFGLAQALEQHPCLIGYLVGAAIAMESTKGLEEMIQQPGCPNLFWAFTDLPQPVLSMRTSVGGERLFLTTQFEHYLQKDRALTNKEIDDCLNELNELMKLEDQRGGLDSVVKNVRIRYSLIAADTDRMKKTRERLIANGTKADVVKTMPELQLAILDDFFRYEVLRDEFFKAYHLPYYEAAPWIEKTEDLLKKTKSKGDIIGPALLPAVWKVKNAQARLDQRIMMLRIIEAIRLYAFENGGKLPESLEDIKLPIPKDPYSGKPFSYTVKEGVATLHGADPKTGPQNYRHYEIQVKK